jgi:hypothetical protein
VDWAELMNMQTGEKHFVAVTDADLDNDTMNQL